VRARQAAAEMVAAAEHANSEQIFDMLSLLSHEVRTPLQIIVLSNDELEETTGRKYSKYTESVRSGTQMLDSVLSRVVDAAKLKRGTIKIITAPFCVRELLGECMAVARRNASQGVDVLGVVSGDGDEYERLPVVGDAKRIQQILLNLLDNACKFTAKGYVEASAAWDADTHMLTMRVSDTGIGVPKEEQAKLFCEFSQAETNRSTVAGGTGLGLYIVKHLVILMNGEVSYDAGPDGGSLFTVTLPLEAAPDSDADRGALLALDRPRGGSSSRPLSIGVIARTNRLRDAYMEAISVIAPFVSVVQFPRVVDAMDAVASCRHPDQQFLLFVDASLTGPQDHLSCRVVLLGTELPVHVDMLTLRKIVSSWLAAGAAAATASPKEAPRRRRQRGKK
jgi:anti-sigma regulatory factor (Ser/Thr protein kinase)